MKLGKSPNPGEFATLLLRLGSFFHHVLGRKDYSEGYLDNRAEETKDNCPCMLESRQEWSK